jgi:hypothetical protein
MNTFKVVFEVLLICVCFSTGASSPLLSGPLAMLPPILDSPVRLTDNNNLHHSPVMPFGTRAMTLPEISGNRAI